MLGLTFVVLALWLACEICGRDVAQSRTPPPDSYRLARWRDGEKG